MEAIFTFTPQNQYSKPSDKAMGLLSQKDFITYLDANAGKRILVTLEHEVVKNEKQKLYAYLRGPLLHCYMECRRGDGEQLDRVTSMLELKCLYLKDLWKDKHDNVHAIILSLGDITKTRLRTFVQDVVQHIEQEYGVEAPNSQEYKLNK
jgi:hypothetical protein